MTKEKTAMEMLIDYMRANFHLTESVEIEFSASLKAEKKQIEDAFDDGVNCAIGNECSFFDLFGTFYFEKKFDNN
jgi:hypothetical protein